MCVCVCVHAAAHAVGKHMQQKALTMGRAANAHPTTGDGATKNMVDRLEDVLATELTAQMKSVGRIEAQTRLAERAVAEAANARTNAAAYLAAAELQERHLLQRVAAKMGDAVRSDGPQLSLRFDRSPQWDTPRVMLPDLTTKEGKKSLESKKRKAEQLTKQQQRLEDRVERERQKAADRLKSTAQREADRIEREQRKRADAARTEEVKAEKVRRLAAPCMVSGFFVFERCLCVARRCLVRGARAHAHHPPRK